MIATPGDRLAASLNRAAAVALLCVGVTTCGDSTSTAPTQPTPPPGRWLGAERIDGEPPDFPSCNPPLAPVVAADASGGIVASWLSGCRIWASVTGRGQAWGRPAELATIFPYVPPTWIWEPTLAANSGGIALIAWAAQDRTGDASSSRDATGRPRGPSSGALTKARRRSSRHPTPRRCRWTAPETASPSGTRQQSSPPGSSPPRPRGFDRSMRQCRRHLVGARVGPDSCVGEPLRDCVPLTNGRGRCRWLWGEATGPSIAPHVRPHSSVLVLARRLALAPSRRLHSTRFPGRAPAPGARTPRRASGVPGPTATPGHRRRHRTRLRDPRPEVVGKP